LRTRLRSGTKPIKRQATSLSLCETYGLMGRNHSFQEAKRMHLWGNMRVVIVVRL
jgi:hypothetical protein